MAGFGHQQNHTQCVHVGAGPHPNQYSWRQQVMVPLITAAELAMCSCRPTSSNAPVGRTAEGTMPRCCAHGVMSEVQCVRQRKPPADAGCIYLLLLFAPAVLANLPCVSYCRLDLKRSEIAT